MIEAMDCKILLILIVMRLGERISDRLGIFRVVQARIESWYDKKKLLREFSIEDRGSK